MKQLSIILSILLELYIKDYHSSMELSSVKGVMGHNVFNNKASSNYVLLFMFPSVMKFLGYNCSKKKKSKNAEVLNFWTIF